MKKHPISTLLCLTIFIFTFSITSFAGTWQSTGNDWKYQKDDGSFLANSWLEDNGASYYFDANGIMLKNTLSPDGYTLGRDGKRIFFDEFIPHVFGGNEAEFITFSDAYMEFSDGYDKNFNSSYDEIYPGILPFDENKDFENARNSINRLDAFDFTPYMTSGNILIRKQATSNEIFRIEQIYYLSEILKMIEQKNYDGYYELCTKMDISVVKQYDNTIDCINRLRTWYNAYY